MNILEEAKEKFFQVISEYNISLDDHITAEPLGVEEALGDPSPYKDFALQSGVEKLVEVKYRDARGQAFTSFPLRWNGNLKQIRDFDIDSHRNRALLTAAMNAVGMYLGLVDKTIHCRDEGPRKCGERMASELFKRFGTKQVIGIVGYQPAIVENIVDRFGSRQVRILDLNPKNIGRTVYGVQVLDGSKELDKISEECTLCLVTGSSIVNSTIDGIIETLNRKNTKVIFFGTTIAFPAVLAGLEHFCYEAV